MQAPSILLRSTVAVLAVAVLAGAPAAEAQRLVAAVGDPIAYRVDVPAGARIERAGYYMTAETDDAHLTTAAVDMVNDADHHLPVSDREARRIVTDMFIGSDSLLLGLIDEGMRRRDVRLAGAVREIRTLGGQRAGYIRGRVGRSKDAPSIEMYVTVKDGIMYMLVFTAVGPTARVESLAARIHQSFVMPDAPPAGFQAPTPRSGVLRRTERSR
jgi:hypothetical protein